MPTIEYAELVQFTQQVIASAGTPADAAQGIAEALVEANLRGHDSHGVLRLPWYIQAIDDGIIKADAQPFVAKRQGAIAKVDGALGWGQLGARLATQTAIEIADTHCIGAVALQNGNHIGRVGEYVERIAAAGKIGIAFCNAGPAVAPFGGHDRIMGTNPFAWAAPRGDNQPPLVLDFATSIVAEGKLRVARTKGELLPHDGMIYNAEGQPSIDPADFYEGGTLLTFGLHKGSGLSLMIEALARGLCGVDPAYTHPHGHNGTIIIAFQVSAFADEEEYFGSVERLSSQVNQLTPNPGVEKVLLPGQPELISRETRLRDGIPIPQLLWDDLVALGARWNITLNPISLA
jgi:LDH2 family malate/lactate/ureidoglycolate dehydrogenase